MREWFSKYYEEFKIVYFAYGKRWFFKIFAISSITGFVVAVVYQKKDVLNGLFATLINQTALWSFICASIGAVIGGVITLFSTMYSMRKQASIENNVERKRNIYQPLLNDMLSNILITKDNIEYSQLFTGRYKGLDACTDCDKSILEDCKEKNIVLDFHRSFELINNEFLLDIPVDLLKLFRDLFKMMFFYEAEVSRIRTHLSYQILLKIGWKHCLENSQICQLISAILMDDEHKFTIILKTAKFKRSEISNKDKTIKEIYAELINLSDVMSSRENYKVCAKQVENITKILICRCDLIEKQRNSYFNRI